MRLDLHSPLLLSCKMWTSFSGWVAFIWKGRKGENCSSNLLILGDCRSWHFLPMVSKWLWKIARRKAFPRIEGMSQEAGNPFDARTVGFPFESLALRLKKFTPKIATDWWIYHRERNTCILLQKTKFGQHLSGNARKSAILTMKGSLALGHFRLNYLWVHPCTLTLNHRVAHIIPDYTQISTLSTFTWGILLCSYEIGLVNFEEAPCPMRVQLQLAIARKYIIEKESPGLRWVH